MPVSVCVCHTNSQPSYYYSGLWQPSQQPQPSGRDRFLCICGPAVEGEEEGTGWQPCCLGQVVNSALGT